MGRFNEIPGGALVYEARNAVFWLDGGVMLGYHMEDRPNVTLEDAIVVLQELREMTGGKRVPLMYDGRGLGWLNVDARGYIRAHSQEVFTHAAVVVKHELVRLLSHAILGIAGMDMPVEIFTDEDKAWRFVNGTAGAA